jgi:hypothetical protein
VRERECRMGFMKKRNSKKNVNYYAIFKTVRGDKKKKRFFRHEAERLYLHVKKSLNLCEGVTNRKSSR